MKKSALYAAFAFLLLSSCSSSKLALGGGKRGLMTGRVCDSDGKPVSGYRIFLDGKKSGVSSAGGIFKIEGVSPGLHEISGEKRGYQSLCSSVEFYESGQIVCLEAKKLPALYEVIEGLLRNGQPEEAVALLEKSDGANKGQAVFEFYKSLSDYCLQPNEKKAGRLAALAGVKNGGKK